MTQPQMPLSEDRWSDEQLERLLAESGRRTGGLSTERRDSVLRVLLAEQERLQQEERRQATSRRGLTTVDWLRLLAGAFALAATLAFALSAYLLVGGSRLPSDATLSGIARVNERRYGVLGLQWSLAQPEQRYTLHPLARGDEVTAQSPVTITFADGSTAVLSAGAQARVLEEGTGLFLVTGEVESIVQPRNPDTPFRVETDFGSAIVRGTVFRTRIQLEAAVEFTDKGIVLVSNALESREVITGEQVRIVPVEPLRPELQAPRARFSSRLPDRILINEAALSFRATIYPSATLVIYDARTTAELGRFDADPAGNVAGAVALAEGEWIVQLRQISRDGRQSALSAPVQVEVDQTPPALQLEPVVQQGARLRVTGRTEGGASVSINGLGVPVQPDGRFETLLDQPRGVITVVARDPAGNEAVIVRLVE